MAKKQGADRKTVEATNIKLGYIKRMHVCVVYVCVVRCVYVIVRAYTFSFSLSFLSNLLETDKINLHSISLRE